MKVTQDQILDLLKAAGVIAVELVEDEGQSEFDLDAALQAIDANRGQILRPTIEAEVTEKIRAEVAGKSGGSLRVTLANKTGIDRNLLKDLKDGEAIQLAIDHVTKKLGEGTEDVAKVINDLTEAKDKEWIEKLTPIEQERDQWKEKFIDRDVLSVIEAELLKAPLPEKLNRQVASHDFKNFLKEKAHLVYNPEKKELGLYSKENNNIPLMNGQQPAKLLDLAKEYFEPRNNWKTDTRDANPADATNANGKPYVAPNQPTPVGNDPVKQFNESVNKYAVEQGLVPAQ